MAWFDETTAQFTREMTGSRDSESVAVERPTSSEAKEREKERDAQDEVLYRRGMQRRRRAAREHEERMRQHIQDICLHVCLPER